MKAYTVVSVKNGKEVPKVITDLDDTIICAVEKNDTDVLKSLADVYSGHSEEEIFDIISGDIYILELELTEKFMLMCVNAALNGFSDDFEGAVISSYQINTKDLAAKIIEISKVEEERRLQVQITKAEARYKSLKPKTKPAKSTKPATPRNSAPALKKVVTPFCL